MTDLLAVLPDLDTAPFADIILSLERHHITTADLLALDAADIAKRAQVPAREAHLIAAAVLAALHAQYGFNSTPDREPKTQIVLEGLFGTGRDLQSRWSTISTLDDTLDQVLNGGIPTAQLTEITGERCFLVPSRWEGQCTNIFSRRSGVGKTQFLLTLLLAVQLPPPRGLGKGALYISTEAPLQTTRLRQLLASHPLLERTDAANGDFVAPSLSRILSIQTPDLEAQDHILRYQLPVAVRRHNVGLVIIDSITTNYRAEFEHGQTGASGSAPGLRHGAAMARRSAQLTELGALLRDLARTANMAVVVANQVADRFAPVRQSSRPSTPLGSQTRAPGSQARAPDGSPPQQDPMTLDHQQNWFTGWGDELPRTDAAQDMGLKTPSLGLTWSNQISCRIALLKGRTTTRWEQDGGTQRRRFMKVVFAPWAPPTDAAIGVEYRIGVWGIRAVRDDIAELPKEIANK